MQASSVCPPPPGHGCEPPAAPAGNDRPRARPYPSLCFSSRLMGAAPVAPGALDATSQSAAAAATRLQGPGDPPAPLMAPPPFGARAAATPGRGDTSPDAGGREAASRAAGEREQRPRRTVGRAPVTEPGPSAATAAAAAPLQPPPPSALRPAPPPTSGVVV